MKWLKFLDEIDIISEDLKIDKEDNNIIYCFNDSIRIERISENYIDVYSYVDIVPDLVMKIMYCLTEMRWDYNFEINKVGIFYKQGNQIYWNDEAIDENEKAKISETLNKYEQISFLENSNPEDLYQC